MKALSKEAEQKILRASELAAEHVNDGLSPNRAIVKAATSQNLPVGHVTLLVNAYNTGRTTRQRELGATPFEKAADFELADAGIVLETLYPSKIKTAAEAHRETTVSFDYAVSPEGMLSRRRRYLEKVSHVATTLPPIAGAIVGIQTPADPTSLLKRAIGRVERNKQAIEDARRVVSATFQKAADTFDELREYFRTSGHISFGDVAQDVELRYGNLGKRVMHEVRDRAPHLAKEATTDRIYMGLSPPATMVGQILQTLGEFGELKQTYEKVAAERAADSAEALRPFVSRPSPCILTEKAFSKAANSFTWGMTGAAAKDMISGLGNALAPPEEKLVNRSLQKLTDPQHEAELRNIRTQAMLHDLMNNDPVLRGYQPDEVLGAFNEIGEVSPRAIDQRLIMTPLLRKRLQQGVLDPFEVDQLLGMEGKLKKRDQVTDDEPSPSIL